MALVFPDIDPVAFTLGPLHIRWYALAYLAGFLLGWRVCLYLVRRPGEPARPDSTDIDDFLPWAILGVILGGRIGYVLFYQFEAYLNAPLEIFKVWHGGMSFHGGLCGLVLAIVLFARRRKIPVLRLADLLSCVAPIGLFLGRIANFVNGELYGRTTDVPWGIVFPDAGNAPRHPSQLYESALEGLVLFMVVFALSAWTPVRNRHPGVVSGVFLAGYALFRFVVEFFREPDSQIGYILETLTMGQILCLPMFAAGAGLALWAARKPAAPQAPQQPVEPHSRDRRNPV